jgi:outer membrane lipoprotein-sorting protein
MRRLPLSSQRSRLLGPTLTGALIAAVAMFQAPQSGLRAAEDELPKGATLIDQYVKATGGKAAYDKVTNRVTKAKMEIARQGIKLSVTIYAARPNKVYTILESDAVGKVEEGCDGTNVWANSDIKGPEVREGKVRSSGLRTATFERFVYWRSVYGKAECTGVATVEDKPCYKVVLTPKEAKSEDLLTVYIDKESNLVRKVETKVVTAAGTIPVEAYLSDYKKVDAILVPHKWVTKLLGQERVMTIESMKQNVKLPADRFDPPADVKELLKKKEP